MSGQAVERAIAVCTSTFIAHLRELFEGLLPAAAWSYHEGKYGITLEGFPPGAAGRFEVARIGYQDGDNVALGAARWMIAAQGAFRTLLDAIDGYRTKLQDECEVQAALIERKLQLARGLEDALCALRAAEMRARVGEHPDEIRRLSYAISKLEKV